MTYRVIYAPSFREDIDQHIDYLLGQHVALHVINGWYAKLYELIDGLYKSPRRFPVDEVQSRITGHETHKLNFGDYLVFYQVDDKRRQVNLVTFRHGARRREA